MLPFLEKDIREEGKQNMDAFIKNIRQGNGKTVMKLLTVTEEAFYRERFFNA